MNMSSSKDSGTIIDPFIDMALMLIELIIDIGINLSTWLVKKAFSKSNKTQGIVEIKHLKTKKRTKNAQYLGISCVSKKPIKLSELKTHMHTLLIGASGSGKSNTLNLLLENSLQKNMPIIYIDPKGSKAAINEFLSLCSYYKKDSYVFCDHYSSPYVFNTFEGLSNDEIVVSIMRSLEWSEPFYKSMSQKALFCAVKGLKKDNHNVNLISIYNWLLENETSNENIAGLMSQLQLIKESTFSKLLEVTDHHIENDLVITTENIKKFQKCLYIGLSTQGKGDIARTFGKIFLNSILMLSHYAGVNYESQEESIKNGLSFVIDEAGSMVFADFIELLNKCRSSGINVYACIQSVADFECLGEDFMRKCMENFNTWLISKQADIKSVKYLADSIGTTQTMKRTFVTEDDQKTSKGSIRETNTYRCHPDILREVGIGQMVLVTRSPYRVDLLNIRYIGDSEAFNHKVENPSKTNTKTQSKAFFELKEEA